MPQTPTYELSSAKKVLPGEKTPFDQVILSLTNVIVGLSIKVN